jgi:uncharacterized membrane protein
MNATTYLYILKWWLVLAILGFSSIPSVYYLFRDIKSFGWAFSKLTGILVVSYLTFLAGIFKLAHFNSTTIFLLWTMFLGINLYIFSKLKREILPKLQKNLTYILIEELLFLFGLVFWSYVRGHQPDIEGLEKFMDYGFVNSLLRSDYLPPIDMWFSGKPINYYWFGHFITALITKATNIPAWISYNLMLATIMGLVLSQTFSIVSGLAAIFTPQKKTIILAAIISATLLVFAGNFHTPYYVLKNGSEKYWYPDATRFIGYNPDVDDKTIHEFPIYSFVVADLHGHLLDLPIVVLYISLLAVYILAEKDKKHSVYSLITLGFLLGVMFMTNTWDFANYLLLTGASFAFFAARKKEFLKQIYISAIWGLFILISAIIFASPFIINFESIAQGIRLTHSHSPLWQLAILWGFPAILTACFSIMILKIKNRLPSDLFIICLLATGWVLIILPEVIYVKDIYIASHYRANTMFKLTYQAFVMFYLSSGYIIFRLLTFIDNKIARLTLSVFFALILYSIMIYPYYAIRSYYGKLGNFKTLDGESWTKVKLENLSNAIWWFRKNTNGQPVILEAPGDSYTQFNIVSAYTGLPTVSGWFVHEWLWRGEAKYPQQRVTDVTTIYTSPSLENTTQELKKYNVRYIIVGQFEREKFPNLMEEKFNKLGVLKAQFGDTKIYEVRSKNQ